MSAQLPSILQAKAHAKCLRTEMAKEGTTIGHAKSLELVAHQFGYADWNALRAAIADKPHLPWAPGDAVSGTYLRQAFTGKVVSIREVELEPGWFELQIHLDVAVDVVTSNRFSNLRRRIRGVVGPKGHSPERTSDGHVHLQIDM